MSLIAAGPDSIVWTASPTAGSPFPGGVVSIVLAWFVTPLMAALIAGLFFLLVKVVVLKAKNPFRMSLFFFPLNSFICAWCASSRTSRVSLSPPPRWPRRRPRPPSLRGEV
jgi:phosphate/sulfate permease